MPKHQRTQKQFAEEQKQKVKQDYAELKAGKRDFHKLLHIAKAKRLEALQQGNKEEAKRLKEEMERLNQDWRGEQKSRWRKIQKDKKGLRS